jgi:hypothetical protein
VRSGPGEARTILLLHIISVRPSKQPLMVRTFLKVYMELGSYFLFLQEQIKDIIIILKPSLCTTLTRQTPMELIFDNIYFRFQKYVSIHLLVNAFGNIKTC